MAKSGKPQPQKHKQTAVAKPTPAVQTKAESKPLFATERPEQTENPLLKKVFYGLAALGLVYMLALSAGSGINADDKFQNDYSAKLVQYYSTFGADTSALFVKDGNMHLYGGLFEIVAGFTNKTLGFKDTDLAFHNIRHAWSAFFGWIAILSAALFAQYLAGWRTGLIALVLLLFSPRFIGDSMMNPKDIPFAAGYMMALYNMVVVIDALPNLRRLNLAGLIGGLAIALALRAGGLLPFAYLAMFGGLQFLGRYGFGGLGNGKALGRYLGVLAGAAAAGYLLAVLFWPYALQSPFKNPMLALSKFADLEVKIRVLYEGVNRMSDVTPWHYPVKWIVYTIPLAVLAGFAGSVVLLRRLLRQYQPLWVLLAFFAAVFPVFYIIYKNSVIHDGWRHLTFVYPPMAVVAALFWNELAGMFSARKPLQYATYGAMGLLLIDSAAFIAMNPKFPYVYFNPINGGINGAYGHFETDYWGVSVRQGIEWMEQQGILKPGMEEPIVIATNMAYPAQKLLAKYGDKVKVKYMKWERRCDDAWDYALYPTRFLSGSTLQRGFWPPDNAVHIVKAGNTPLLAVLKDNNRNCAFGMAAVKLGDWNSAIERFKEELSKAPDNDLAWSNLAQAQLNLNQLEEAKASAEKALEISPDDTQANNLIGMYWINKNDAGKAKSQFELALKREPSNPGAYYYLALIAQNQGDNRTALNNLEKALQIAPNFVVAYELAAQIYESEGNTSQAQQIRAMMGQIK